MATKLDPTQDFNWSTLATIPEGVRPSVWGVRGSDIRGREGDIIVQRIPSSSRLNFSQLQSLRSLRLPTVGSAALWRSSLPGILGQIENVREHVAVIELGRIIYLGETTKNSELQYERTKYGTNTNPGELIRDREGNFFAFESDRRRFRIMWSSPLTHSRAITELLAAFPDLENGSKSESVAVFSDTVSPVEGTASEILDRCAEREDDLKVVRISYRDLDYTWQETHQPFHDRAIRCREIGVNMSNVALRSSLTRASIESFALRTGPGKIIRSGQCEIAVRIDGNVHTIPLTSRPEGTQG